MIIFCRWHLKLLNFIFFKKIYVYSLGNLGKVLFVFLFLFYHFSYCEPPTLWKIYQEGWNDVNSWTQIYSVCFSDSRLCIDIHFNKLHSLLIKVIFWNRNSGHDRNSDQPIQRICLYVKESFCVHKIFYLIYLRFLLIH